MIGRRRLALCYAALLVLAWCLGLWLGHGVPYQESEDVRRELEHIRALETLRVRALAPVPLPGPVVIAPPNTWGIATDAMVNYTDADPHRPAR